MSLQKGQYPFPAIPADVIELANLMVQANTVWLLFIFSTLCAPWWSLKACEIIPYTIPPSMTTKESPAEHSSCFIQMIAYITRGLSLLITSQQRNAFEEMTGWVQTGTFSKSKHFPLPGLEMCCGASALQRLWLQIEKVQQVTVVETITKAGKQRLLSAPWFSSRTPSSSNTALCLRYARTTYIHLHRLHSQNRDMIHQFWALMKVQEQKPDLLSRSLLELYLKLSFEQHLSNPSVQK